MTVQPSPYDLLRGLQDQIAVLHASLAAIDRAASVLAGMLDASAPDPVLDWHPSRPTVEPPPRQVAPAEPPAPLAEGEARVLPTPRCSRRIKGETARPPVVFKLQGVEIKTTQRRVDLINAVSAEPLTLKAMVDKGLAPSVAGVKAQIYDTNLDLDAAGSPLRIRMNARQGQRRGARGGREPARYALLPAKDIEIAPPEFSTTAQSEGVAGSIPEQEAPASAAGDGENACSAQGAAFAMPSGAGEGAAKLVDPAPVADEAAPSIAVPPQPPVQIEAKAAPARQLMGRLPIEPGDLLAVDIKAKRVQTRAGAYEVGGANLARALDMMKGGHLFGLDVIAKKAGWPTAEVAKTALGFERNRLAQHGIDLFLDKFNARLRVPA